MMLYRMTTGRRRVGREKWASRLVAGLDSVWDRLIGACLQEHPADRPHGMVEVAVALAKLEILREPRPETARSTEPVRLARDATETHRPVPKRAREGQPPAGEVAKSRPEAERERWTAQATPPKPRSPPKSSKGWFWALAVLMIGGGVIWAVSRQASLPASRPPAAATPGATSPEMQGPGTTALPDLQSPFINSLGMELLPVAGLEDVLFSKWEIRVQDYAPFARETGTDWPQPDFEQGPTHPAVNVNWDDTQAFCHWLTKKERAAGKIGPGLQYRLPADWEWSLAVGIREPREGTPESKSGKEDRTFPWNRGQGTWPPTGGAGNYCGQETHGDAGRMIAGFNDHFRRTSPAGSFEPNANGLFDMGGNVWEWCGDSYGANPQWRVLRGGSWCSFSHRYLLSSYRDGYGPARRFGGSGFRVVMSRASP